MTLSCRPDGAPPILDGCPKQAQTPKHSGARGLPLVKPTTLHCGLWQNILCQQSAGTKESKAAAADVASNKSFHQIAIDLCHRLVGRLLPARAVRYLLRTLTHYQYLCEMSLDTLRHLVIAFEVFARAARLEMSFCLALVAAKQFARRIAYISRRTQRRAAGHRADTNHAQIKPRPQSRTNADFITSACRSCTSLNVL